jgi:cephalosporin-C deacetylase-like acetyl esterase
MITKRRTILQSGAVASLSLFELHHLFAAESIPQSVLELWADFDPRRDPIETEVIREWKEDGMVLRHVRYFIGSFKGKPARMAAVYGFPEGTKEKLPAVMHIHGGGQRGSVSEVKLLVARGYAALSVNWGGSGTGKAPFNTCEKAEPGDPNTDWGAVDPSQLNVPGLLVDAARSEAVSSRTASIRRTTTGISSRSAAVAGSRFSNSSRRSIRSASACMATRWAAISRCMSRAPMIA